MDKVQSLSIPSNQSGPFRAKSNQLQVEERK